MLGATRVDATVTKTDEEAKKTADSIYIVQLEVIVLSLKPSIRFIF